ncbi:5'-3' exonuclease [Paenibacillus alvei]|uniref:5'-3' exonuclease n=1 Tax=Paenibacillus TaxID=44249 RepID=UPI000288F5AC|nr:5'-3' exonuclease H3TH domain-containing protein [Paenibacillus alvei]EJW16511.1 5'-3' exonuclease YpcP [Paenibacillus alvei DSM 29]MCY7484735.1 5'-3' exonuclease [Paenibacillus alvei]MCY9542401.1 5'-3' exonuclease [Paenibacillus alvei]MCY9704252.1 5'-3' exonuclease [Paenibacillus alvei]MCY9733479.1 5'-3' exonuclease [Paenibacillus alvei]
MEVQLNGNKEQRLLLVDGMALLFRAYFATAYGGSIRRMKDGTPTNAVYGFMRYFWDAVERFEPTHIACCWDLGSKTFRSEQFTDYKANRPDCPEDLVPQFQLIRDVMDGFGIPNISAEGYEADDCIGTLARLFREDMHVYVLTGDHDMLQLVHDKTTVVIMKKGHGNYAVYSPLSLLEERQLTPEQVIDVKGLMGDTADNYPGVRGIGEKTAHKLIQQYSSIEGILENLSELAKGVRTKIEADLDMLHLSRQLARIQCDVPVECKADVCVFAPERESVSEIFERLEMKSMISYVGL